MNKSIILWRHIVGVAIALAIQSDVESVSYFVGRWVGAIVIVFGFAGAISGLGYLFFTSYLKGKGGRTFVICAWVTAGVLLFGQWVVPGMVQRIKSSDSRPAFSDFQAYRARLYGSKPAVGTTKSSTQQDLDAYERRLRGEDMP